MPVIRQLGYTALIGDGSSETVTVTHNLNSQSVIMSLRSVASGREVVVEWAAATINTVVLYFSTAPATGAYRIVIQKI